MKQLATLAVVSVVLINLAGSVGAQSGRALTIEDYYKIKSVGDSQISPDGKWVAFTLSTRVEEDNTTAIETFVVPADGSAAPRRISHEGKSVAQPRWTEDNLLHRSTRRRTVTFSAGLLLNRASAGLAVQGRCRMRMRRASATAAVLSAD